MLIFIDYNIFDLNGRVEDRWWENIKSMVKILHQQVFDRLGQESPEGPDVFNQPRVVMLRSSVP